MALRSTRCNCYNALWGSRGCAFAPWLAGRPPVGRRRARITLLMTSLSVMPTLAACSSWSNPYQTASTPDPAAAGYPTQSLTDTFRGSTASAQPANVPHPPSTYTPVNQPYSPPPGQPAYGAPRYAAGVTPVAAAAPPDADLAANAYPYPKQSLFDTFRGSTESAQPSVPHPPSTYTPVNQPYSQPPGQPANGAPAGAAPAAAAPNSNTDPSGYPYPKQSLFDVFSN